jgi:aspartate-semialdehyde dehydrogenase
LRHYTEAMAEYKLKGGSKKGGIIANPNCSTIIALMAGRCRLTQG